MILEKYLNFIDSVTFFDFSCFVTVYLIFFLLLINLLTKFKIVRFSQYFHIIISGLIFVALIFYLFSYNTYQIRSSVSSFLIEIIILSNVVLFIYYSRYERKMCCANLDVNDKGLQTNNNCNYISDDTDVDSNSDGIYTDYKYYYDNRDKYSEPYTTPVTYRNTIAGLKHDCFYKNDFKKDASYNNYKKDTTNNSYQSSYNGLFDKKDDFLKRKTNNFEEVYNVMKQSNIQNDCENGLNKNIFSEKRQNKNVTISNKNDVVDNVKTIEDNKGDVNCVDVCCNNELKIDDFFIKVNDMLDANSRHLNQEIDSVKSEVKILKDGLQGFIDRITKLFELFIATNAK